MRISAQVQQPSLLNIDLHSTVREQQVQTSNTIYTDKYNPVRSIHQTHVKHLKCHTGTDGVEPTDFATCWNLESSSRRDRVNADQRRQEAQREEGLTQEV